MMGCHTWFSRPITQREYKFMKEYAPTEIYELCGNPDAAIYDKNLYDLLMKSYNENIPCVYGKYWWQLGYGSGHPEFNKSVREIRCEDGLFVDVDEFTDIFRVRNYPSKVIHSRHELRKWMGKRYFELNYWKLERVSEFFSRHPGGVITFG